MKWVNPFVVKSFDGAHEMQAWDAESRIAAVKSFNAEECERALGVPNLQRMVRAAVERRLRQLARELAR